jgi:hypothetical protein
VSTKVQPTDILTVNRGGTPYKITGAKFLAGNFLDTDLFLVNRGGVDYKATGALMRAILQRAPVIGTVVLSEEDTAGAAFTSQKFKTTITLTDAGQPAATVGLKAYVEGTFTTVVDTDVITSVTTYADPVFDASYQRLGSPKWRDPSGSRLNLIRGSQTSTLDITDPVAFWGWTGTPFTIEFDLTMDHGSNHLTSAAQCNVTIPSGNKTYNFGRTATETRVIQLPVNSQNDLPIELRISANGDASPGCLVDVSGMRTVAGGTIHYINSRLLLTFKTDKNLASINVGDRFDIMPNSGSTRNGEVRAKPATNQLVVSLGGPFLVTANTDYLHITRVTAGARLYLKFNAAGTVTDMQSADPGFVTMTNAATPVLTFPATFPSGNAPDVELPNGTTITAVVQASNTSGSLTKTSNTLTPAR